MARRGHVKPNIPGADTPGPILALELLIFKNFFFKVDNNNNMDLLLAVEKTRFPQRLQKIWGLRNKVSQPAPAQRQLGDQQPNNSTYLNKSTYSKYREAI